MRSYLLALLCIFTVALSATGNIAGKVVLEQTGEGMPNIAVVLEGAGVGAMTNRNGGYIIKNAPAGDYTLVVRYIGHKSINQPVTVVNGETVIVNLSLEVSPLAIEGMKVSANRAVRRETPVAFSTLNEEELSDRYTTQDVPQLMDDVPGLFASSLGLGESEITMRGFDADKVQILINGIPVNDPESQQVYWSNWTGLASNVKSVQVQRGAGSSLYGSGAFGGSVNIETMGSSVEREIEVRSSFGAYSTDSKVADGKGGMEDYSPMNYNIIARYRSGQLHNGQFNYSLMAERKGGDSYVNGTTYDGWSFSIEAASRIGNHSLNYSLIGAPQKHNQTGKVSDPNLFGLLGREYNRRNSDFQENYYFKPQLSIRDEWIISDHQTLMANVFATMGKGGGKYLYNDTFDGDIRYDTETNAWRIPTGAIGFQPIDVEMDNLRFARNALWAYIDHGVVLDGFDPNYEDANGTQVYTYYGYDPATGDYTDEIRVRYDPSDGSPDHRANLASSTYDHSWTNDSQNDHIQFGLNTYYEHVVNKQLTMTVGGEIRRWMADHYAESHDFRCYDPVTGDVRVYDEVQRRYDYSSVVHNMSCFIRLEESPIPERLNFVADVQFANYYSEIDENPIDIFDYRAGRFSGESFYATKTMMDDNETPEDPSDDKLMFSDDDYNKTFRFISPKFGMNMNLSDEVNFIVNYSVAYKEPRTYEWYDRVDGPDANQYDSETGAYVELNPEKAKTFEFGFGYTGVMMNLNANFYQTEYTDKIESVTKQNGSSVTMNAGSALHQGWEYSGSFFWGNWDANASLTVSTNRWTSMNVDRIFSVNAEDVIGKVVPFSPEQMANGGVGYTFFGLPNDSNLRIGLSARWWDEYYGSYTNRMDEPVYSDDGSVQLVDKEAKLPEFVEFNTDIKYEFKIMGKDASVKLDLNNITDRENYSAASWSSDYGTNNQTMNGKRYMYVTPSPRFNVFTTVSVKF